MAKIQYICHTKQVQTGGKKKNQGRITVVSIQIFNGNSETVIAYKLPRVVTITSSQETNAQNLNPKQIDYSSPKNWTGNSSSFSYEADTGKDYTSA